eukprot:336170-Chlamydomonas_euryale.AAC.1
MEVIASGKASVKSVKSVCEAPPAAAAAAIPLTLSGGHGQSHNVDALFFCRLPPHVPPCQVEDVVDAVVVNLSKVPAGIANVSGVRPDVAFGRDAKMREVTRTLAAIANRHGDSLTSGWNNVVELIVCFYRLQVCGGKTA